MDLKEREVVIRNKLFFDADFCLSGLDFNALQ
jgi:hypothetical protein